MFFTGVASSTRKRDWVRISAALLLILICSFCLNYWGNDFPLSLHPDEIKKVLFIRGDAKTDFYHPQLILKFGRIFADIANASLRQEIAQAARTSTALLGSIAVLFTFCLAKQFLSAPASLLAASLLAVSPGIVIHSHYLKEDIALTCFATASLLLAIVTAKESSGDSSSKATDCKVAVIWGLLTGLAISSKYTAFILFPFYFFLPWLIKKIHRKIFHKQLIISGLIAAMIFLLINNQLFTDFKTFFQGLDVELHHVISGHGGIKIYPWHNLIHLTKNLPDSIGPLTLILGLFGMSGEILRWRRVDISKRTALYFTIYVYIILECLPLKPPPGEARYVLPLIPPLTCFAASAVSELSQWLKSRSGFSLFVAIALSVTTLMPSLSRSLVLNQYLRDDIRTRIPETISTYLKPIAIDTMGSTNYTGYNFLEDSIKEEISTKSHNIFDQNNALESQNKICTFITSSFIYDRYLMASNFSGQGEWVYKKSHFYQKLFDQPFKEINPEEPSYSFVNPTLRVVNLCLPKTE